MEEKTQSFKDENIDIIPLPIETNNNSLNDKNEETEDERDIISPPSMPSIPEQRPFTLSASNTLKIEENEYPQPPPLPIESQRAIITFRF